MRGISKPRKEIHQKPCILECTYNKMFQLKVFLNSVDCIVYYICSPAVNLFNNASCDRQMMHHFDIIPTFTILSQSTAATQAKQNCMSIET